MQIAIWNTHDSRSHLLQQALILRTSRAIDKESVYYNTFATYADVYNEEDGEPQCNAGTDKTKVDGEENGNDSRLEDLDCPKSI